MIVLEPTVQVPDEPTFCPQCQGPMQVYFNPHRPELGSWWSCECTPLGDPAPYPVMYKATHVVTISPARAKLLAEFLANAGPTCIVWEGGFG